MNTAERWRQRLAEVEAELEAKAKPLPTHDIVQRVRAILADSDLMFGRGQQVADTLGLSHHHFIDRLRARGISYSQLREEEKARRKALMEGV